MALESRAAGRAGAGFSLVELMVAMVVGLLGILAIMSVFLVSEGQKRTTTGGADAHENALIGLVTIERDLRAAGLGLVGLDCAAMNGYSTTLGNFTFAPLPVTITPNTPVAGTDTVTIVHSTSSFGNLPTTLAAPMATSDDVLTVVNGDGFTLGDLIMIWEPTKSCTLLQASVDSVQAGAVWTIAHLPVATSPFNPPIGNNIFPPGGYAVGARVTHMGAGPCCQVPAAVNPMVRREYFIQGTSLMARNRNVADTAVAPANPAALVEGLIGIRAQYGRDTNSDGFIDVYDTTAPATAAQLVAIRVAVIARSGQLEKTAVSPSTLTLWQGGTVANGGAITLDATAQLYRYKVYQTTIPLRNVIWTNN